MIPEGDLIDRTHGLMWPGWPIVKCVGSRPAFSLLLPQYGQNVRIPMSLAGIMSI